MEKEIPQALKDEAKIESEKGSTLIIIQQVYANYFIAGATSSYVKAEREKGMIEFAEWISNNKLDFQPATNGQFIGLDMVHYTAKQLLTKFEEERNGR